MCCLQSLLCVVICLLLILCSSWGIVHCSVLFGHPNRVVELAHGHWWQAVLIDPPCSIHYNNEGPSSVALLFPPCLCACVSLLTSCWSALGMLVSPLSTPHSLGLCVCMCMQPIYIMIHIFLYCGNTSSHSDLKVCPVLCETQPSNSVQ